MFRKALIGFAVLALLVATPYVFGAFDRTEASAPCACCGEACTCVDCVCDANGCACSDGGACACTGCAAACCSEHWLAVNQ